MRRWFPIAASVLAIAAFLAREPITAQQTGEQCGAVTIRCPLVDSNGVGPGCPTPTDGGRFQRNRVNPVDGVVRNHNGVDYPAATGTPVRAAADGVVEISRENSTDGRLGQHMIIRHQDGSATMYAHLSNRAIAAGQPVTAGETIIGLAGSTGQSTGPHLHLEYAPSGAVYANPNRIDPHACIGRNVSGSITIRDNGNIADDAFQVSVDGREVGRTQIGQPNSIAVNNLLPGQHRLTITVLIAPDNQGTYEVSLSNGWTFVGGGTARSAFPPQGASDSYDFIVPAAP